jgi:hypothetical protein
LRNGAVISVGNVRILNTRQGHRIWSAAVDRVSSSWHAERAGQKTVTTVHAHFDGKVIVPDEPLNLPPNQALIVSIEPVTKKQEAAEESVLSWLAANAVESDALPADLADQHDHYLYGRSNGQR